MWAAALLVAVGVYEPVDLRAVMNANPLSDADMRVEGVDIPAQQYLWIEGESAGAMSEGLGAEPAGRASNGEVLGGGFGNNPGDWAEWYFDFPFNAKDAILYVRTARAGENAFTGFVVTLNGEKRGEVLAPVNAGWGDSDEDFVRGLCSVRLGAVHMGRQALRFEAGETYEPVAIDGMWLAVEAIDIVNRIGENGRMRPPASPYMVSYQPGLRTLRGTPFDLIDPEANDGKGIVRLAQGESVTIPFAAYDASGIQFLGAGIRGACAITVTFRTAEGEETVREAELGPLYVRQSEGGVMTVGRFREVYRAAVPGIDGAAASVTVTTSGGEAILLAATAGRPRATP